MSIKQQLLDKLQPHEDRISHGQSNDFDFLPAVLLYVLKEAAITQDGQAQTNVRCNQVSAEIERAVARIQNVETLAGNLARDVDARFNEARTDSATSAQRNEQLSLSLSKKIDGLILPLQAELTALTISTHQFNVKLFRLVIGVLVVSVAGLSLAVVMLVR